MTMPASYDICFCIACGLKERQITLPPELSGN